MFAWGPQRTRPGTEKNLHGVSVGAARRERKHVGVSVGEHVAAIGERIEQCGFAFDGVKVVEVAVKRLLAGVRTERMERIESRQLEPPAILPSADEPGTVVLGTTNFRRRRELVALRADDRRRHSYIVGKTGTGKSTLLLNLIAQDAAQGHGLAVIEPHGQLIEDCLQRIPRFRTNDVILFDPAEHPIAFNPLACSNAEQRPLVAAGGPWQRWRESLRRRTPTFVRIALACFQHRTRPRCSLASRQTIRQPTSQSTSDESDLELIWLCTTEMGTSATRNCEDKNMQSLKPFATTSDLVRYDLGEGLDFYVTRLPERLRWDRETFEKVWSLRPAHDQFVKIRGVLVRIPRGQQAFGADYRFSGTVSQALPVPQLLRGALEWAQTTIEPALVGLLVNWYEGRSEYIGTHRDSIQELIPGTPIVTISFGEARIFRLTRGKGEGKQVRDFTASDGCVFVMPWETNRAWYHEVPKRATYTGRRISVTLRAFRSGVLPPDKYFAAD